MVLNEFSYQDRKLEFVSAYNAADAKNVLETDPNFAIALVDVVMENDSAGLELVRWIRETLGNHQIRLVLRTGQPGIAPEEEVIRKYEINDYKSKSELSAQKLTTTIFASLRAYRDILSIERTRIGLEVMLDASTENNEQISIEKFTVGLMTQLMALLQLDFNDKRCSEDGIVFFSPPKFKVFSSCGIFSNRVNSDLNDTEKEMLAIATSDTSQSWQECWVEKNGVTYLMYLLENSKEPLAIFIRSKKAIDAVDRKMVQIYVKKAATTLEHLILQDKHRRSQDVTIRSLAKLAEYRDCDTGEHLDRVEHLCDRFASQLFILKQYPDIIDNIFLNMIGPASILHDIGKVGIPDAILLKTGKLEDDEWLVMKEHVSFGSNVLSAAVTLSNHEDPFLIMADRIARHHHESWDGEGYPDRLVGENIPLEARIMSIVDVYDALMSVRPYKKAWSQEEALTWIENQSGIKFDPNLVSIFIDMIKTSETH